MPSNIINPDAVILSAASARRSQRGMGLVATMLVLLGVLAMTLVGVTAGGGGKGYGGLIGTANNAVQSSAARTRSAASFNMAESGLQYTMAWLSAQSSPPNSAAAFAPTGLWGATINGTRAQLAPDPSDPSSYFSVRIYPDSYNSDVYSPTSTQKKYLIESVGVSGGITTIVQAYVEQKSLSQYLVLLNAWNNSGNYWVSGLTTFDGPVHDNNIGPDGHGANGDTQTPDGTPENILWKSGAGTPPMFTYTGDDAYSVSSPTGIAYWKDQFNAPGTPQVLLNPDGTTKANQWLNLAAGGAGTVKQGTPVVPFPTTSGQQRGAAIGAATSLNPSGVTLCSGGGVYIEGNVDEMALSATGTNNTTQVITITQGATVQRVTINPVTGATLETQQPDLTWKQVATQAAGINGVVYCNGNVGAQGDPKTGGVHGQVADNLLDASGNLLHNNALTLATPQTANCNVDGSITYNTKRQVSKDAGGNPVYIDVDGNHTSDPAKGTPVYVGEDKDPGFVSHAGTLGLISNNVLVTKKDSTGADLNNFEMDGTVLASGLYDADHWGDRAVGLWENMGGYLSSTVGTFGVFDGNTLKLTNGFNTQFNYDARMRNNPPPFFPTTGNQYNIISWQQVGQTLE